MVKYYIYPLSSTVSGSLSTDLTFDDVHRIVDAFNATGIAQRDLA